MIDEFTHYAIRISVAQICRSIGWASITDTSLNILEDLLKYYINNLAKLSHNYAELFGQCEPTINHLGLAFKDMGISITELEDYVMNVESSAVIDVPKYPIPRESHLNLLKPGSREVVTRPVHIHEHLPPMHPHLESDEYSLKHSPLSVDVTAADGMSPLSSPQNVFKRPDEPSTSDYRRVKSEEEIRPLREISSVMMTTSGFLSHAREGKLPEARTQPIMEFLEEGDNEATNNETQIAENELSQSSFESKNEKKKKHKSLTDEEKKNEDSKGNESDSEDEFKSFMREIAKLKHPRPPEKKIPSPQASKPKSHKHSTLKIKDPNSSEHSQKMGKLKTPKIDKKPVLPCVRETFKETNVDSDVKLSSEPDRHKLNILKKISKVKDEHEEIKDLQSKGENQHDEDNQHKVSQGETSKEKNIPPSAGHMEIESTSSPCDAAVTFNDDVLTQGTPRTPRTPDLPKFTEHKKKKKDKHKEKKEPLDVDRFQDFSPKARYIDDNFGKPKTPEVVAKDDDNQTLNVLNTYPSTSAPAGLIPPWNPSLISYLYSSSPGVPVPPIPSPSAKDVPPMPLLMPHTISQSVSSPLSSTVQKESLSKGEENIKKKSHKEEKKLKAKKKKEKKEKIKIRDKNEKRKLKLEKRQKEKLKKEKKEKKREKEMMMEKVDSPSGAVPKITFKLGPEDSTADAGSRKFVIKHMDKKNGNGVKEELNPQEQTKIEYSAPVPHQPKTHKQIKSNNTKGEIKMISRNILPTPSSLSPILPTVTPMIPEMFPTKVDIEQKIWICPACNHPDDGSPMIACDICDQWFHWLCVGIMVAPESDWYCNTCLSKREEVGEKKKKRRKKC